MRDNFRVVKHEGIIIVTMDISLEILVQLFHNNLLLGINLLIMQGIYNVF